MLNMKLIWPEATLKVLYFFDNIPARSWVLDYGIYILDEFSAWRKQSASLYDIFREEIVFHFDLKKKKFNWIEDS